MIPLDFLPRLFPLSSFSPSFSLPWSSAARPSSPPSQPQVDTHEQEPTQQQQQTQNTQQQQPQQPTPSTHSDSRRAFAFAGPGYALNGKPVAEALQRSKKLLAKHSNNFTRSRRGADVINALNDPERRVLPKPVAKAVGAALRRQENERRRRALLEGHRDPSTRPAEPMEIDSEPNAGSSGSSSGRRKRRLDERDDDLADDGQRKRARTAKKVTFMGPISTIIEFFQDDIPHPTSPQPELEGECVDGGGHAASAVGESAAMSVEPSARAPFGPAKQTLDTQLGEQLRYPSPPVSPPTSSTALPAINTLRSPPADLEGAAAAELNAIVAACEGEHRNRHHTVGGTTTIGALVGSGVPYLGSSEGAVGLSLGPLLGAWAESAWG